MPQRPEDAPVTDVTASASIACRVADADPKAITEAIGLHISLVIMRDTVAWWGPFRTRLTFPRASDGRHSVAVLSDVGTIPSEYGKSADEDLRFKGGPDTILIAARDSLTLITDATDGTGKKILFVVRPNGSTDYPDLPQSLIERMIPEDLRVQAKAQTVAKPYRIPTESVAGHDLNEILTAKHLPGVR